MRALDLHPDDLAHRLDLVRAYRAAREDAGYTLRQFGALLGCGFRAVSLWELKRIPNPLLDNLQERARHLRRRVTFHLAGLPPAVDDPACVILRAIAASTDRARAEAAQRDLIRSHLAAARGELGVTRKQLGRRLGVTGKAVAAIEDGEDGQKMATFQRIARALGGVFTAALSPALPTIDKAIR